MCGQKAVLRGCVDAVDDARGKGVDASKERLSQNDMCGCGAGTVVLGSSSKQLEGNGRDILATASGNALSFVTEEFWWSVSRYASSNFLRFICWIR